MRIHAHDSLPEHHQCDQQLLSPPRPNCPYLINTLTPNPFYMYLLLSPNPLPLP
jgi:hypothetical protein